MGTGAARGISGADRFEIEGVEFVPAWGRPSRSGSLTLLKAARMVPLYEALLRPYPNPNLVELGISQGGSVALLALLTRPQRFVAIDIDATPIDALTEVLEAHGLADTVLPFYGVDQADRERLAEIVDGVFGEKPLDVVVDDASHRYAPTLASFEVLFPRLRPGGVYVIEDWTCEDILARAMERVLADPTMEQQQERLMSQVVEQIESTGEPQRPISRIALELTLAVAQSCDVVSDVHVDENWISVHRGEAPIDRATFALADLYKDRHHQLAVGSLWSRLQAGGTVDQ